MKALEVFDPAMCCSTGVCGVDVDPLLCLRGEYELPYIRRVTRDLSPRAALVPWLAEAPVGGDGLARIVR